jgi:hypothetical protein
VRGDVGAGLDWLTGGDGPAGGPPREPGA